MSIYYDWKSIGNRVKLRELCWSRTRYRPVGGGAEGLKEVPLHHPTGGTRLRISPLHPLKGFFCSTVCDVFCFSTFRCSGNVNVSQVVIVTQDREEKLLSVARSGNAQLESFACCGKKSATQWRHRLGNIVVLQKKKTRITNNNVDVFVFQLLIKATYFLYGFSYLFCDIELRATWLLWWSALFTVCHLVAPRAPSDKRHK